MVHPVVFALATGMGLLTDKYELAVTNFVDHLASFEASDFEKDFVKAAMYGGAILGMVTFGPISDYLGRRLCLIACSWLCLLGALGSAFSQTEGMLIAFRIVTGIGMGGEYPLAASHSAESAKDSSDGGRNVGLLYLFGSGFGQALCPLVVYILLSLELSDGAVWRGTFLVGAVFAGIGLVLRVLTTEDSERFVKAAQSREASRSSTLEVLRAYAMPLFGTAFSWFLYDVIEYGLKQNDAAIFTATTGDYKDSVLTVFCTRLLVLPALLAAAYLPKCVAMKWVQLAGFVGCALANSALALFYPELHIGHELVFDTLYIVQLSFQALPGVTTMAIPAEIFPSAFRGTAHGISAATGKLGAVIGSYSFANMKSHGHLQAIFWVVTATSCVASVVTLAFTPHYSGRSIDKADELSRSGDQAAAVRVLYGLPVAGKEVSDQKVAGSKLGEGAPENHSDDASESTADVSSHV